MGFDQKSVAEIQQLLGPDVIYLQVSSFIYLLVYFGYTFKIIILMIMIIIIY